MTKVADRLDSRVAQLVLELEKKSTLLNETLETLKKREQVLSHEREMFEEKVQWERNHLQVGYTHTRALCQDFVEQYIKYEI